MSEEVEIRQDPSGYCVFKIGASQPLMFKVSEDPEEFQIIFETEDLAREAWETERKR